MPKTIQQAALEDAATALTEADAANPIAKVG